ncbi:CopD family protein [Rhizobium sp. NPDC090279]|uniref:CopD family protein n=1 Tax=Rhizobium sp. NPDC090279 TaxID=3364499 RepID=UPI00383A8D29
MYLYLKALHIFSVVVFVGGTLTMGLLLRFIVRTDDRAQARRLTETLLHWDGLVTTPALGFVWAAGFTMAFGAGWFTSPWLLLKIGPALLLSGVHGLGGMALRRFLRDGRPVSPLFGLMPMVVLAILAVIAWLAVVKPF